MLAPAFTLLHGQEALRSALEGDQAYRTRTSTEYRPGDQMRAGPVQFTAGVSYSLEWNDNVYGVPENTEGDFIQRPQLHVQALWAATRESVLNFGLGIGYQAYARNKDLSRFTITPDSELAWDIPVKDFVFTLYERFSYSQDVASQAALSGTADFPRIENTAGIRARWNPDRYQFEAGYGHYNFFGQSGEFDYLTRSAEQFFGRAGYHFAAATLAGVETSAGLTDYDAPLRSDNSSVSVGPFMEWQVARDFEFRVRGGYVLYSTDPSPVTASLSEDVSSYYFGLTAEHRLTDALNHGLTVAREVQQGLNRGSEFIEQLTVRYYGSWAFYRYATLTADLFYERGKEPQLFGPILGGTVVDEVYDRYGFGFGLNYQLQRHLSAGLRYQFTDKDSNINLRDYRQNTVTLSANYRF